MELLAEAEDDYRNLNEHTDYAPHDLQGAHDPCALRHVTK